ncbi:MAG: hypothetical protein ACRENL_01475 [Candidatus Dormibacteria bacterium]
MANHASADVIIQAPMSYAGSGKRIWRLTQRGAPLIILAVILIGLAWTVVTVWYLTFGLLLVPYRLVRRGGRKEKRDKLRHQELLAAGREGKGK